MPSRIVEYATREQAQQAVSTLSNQNLMGRLVYVREVRRTFLHSSPPVYDVWTRRADNGLVSDRTARPNLASLALPLPVVAMNRVPAVVVGTEAVVTADPTVVVDVRSTSQTFVA